MSYEGFKIDNIDGLQKAMAGVINRFPQEQEKELLKISYMGLREVVLLCPVDSGRLRASLTFIPGSTSSQEHEGKNEGGITKGQNSTEFGTNVNYAQALEEGFQVNQRFVPGQWQGGKFKYIPYTPGSKVGGMMLHPQFILGKHFFSGGMQAAEPKIRAELESWTGKILESIEKNNSSIVSTFQDL